MAIINLMKMFRKQKNFAEWVFLTIMIGLSFINAYPTFDEYVGNFEKNYTSDQYAIRNQIYDARIETFANFTLFTPGVNNLTDWTEQEIACKYI